MDKEGALHEATAQLQNKLPLLQGPLHASLLSSFIVAFPSSHQSGNAER